MVVNTNRYRINAPQRGEQVVLLKAMQISNDPKKWRDMMGVKSVADVYRTLDKLSIRTEYHDALSRAGFSLDKVVQGIQEIAESSEKDDTRLKAYQTILKSIGLDKYEASEAPSGGTWEEELLKSIEKSKTDTSLEKPDIEYEVDVPEVPESVKKLRQEESDLTDSIYGQ